VQWCASCKGLYPKLSNLCAENPQILVVKINFEENRELAKKLGVKV
jgi:thiol-disulfide isomerase/thioredoxin